MGKEVKTNAVRILDRNKIYILQIRIIPVLKPIKCLLQKLHQKPKAKRAVRSEEHTSELQSR